MRRLILSLAALTLLGASVGCRQVGGICDCYGYGCYPNCYGQCGAGPKLVTPGSVEFGHGHGPVGAAEPINVPGGAAGDARALPSAPVKKY